MKVYERIAEAFKAEGATRIFGMSGDGNMYWIGALQKIGVEVLEVRHEGAGLGMADGWARATRNPGIATTTCGPGVSQLATALITARRAQSPLVVFVGEHPTNDDEYNQHLDQAAFAAACETGFLRISTPEVVDDMVRKAFYFARVQSRPIMLSAPMDVQQQMIEVDGEYKPSTSVIARPVPVPTASALKEAVDVIFQSSKPVIIAGRGAMASGAGDAILKLADRIGALISTTLLAKTWLSEDPFQVGLSGNYATRAAINLFEEADCVIAVGASLNRFTTEHGYLYPNARFVHLDTQSHVLMGDGRSADVYLQTDAAAGLEAIDLELELQGFRSTGYRTNEVRSLLADAWDDADPFEIEEGTVDPRAVIRMIDEAAPRGIGINTGSGATAGFSNMLFRRPRDILLAGHFYGCIGQHMPAAIGAALATKRPFILVDGDASILMHLVEFETAVRYDIPLLIVVLNNEMLGAEYYKLEARGVPADFTMISTPDMGKVGAAFGGKGRLARSLDDVRECLHEWLTEPCPMLLDVRVSRNVIPIPYRRIHYGQDV